MTIAVYKPLGLDGYEYCHPLYQDDFEKITSEINGLPKRATWKPIRMRLIREDEGHTLRRSDSPWLGSESLIFRSSAIVALSAMLQEYGELLPLSCGDISLSIYNPTRIIDALDEEASTLRRFSGGEIMMIRQYVFIPEVIRGVDIFKISSLRVSPTFVGQKFVDLWNERGLTGLEFKEIWRG